MNGAANENTASFGCFTWSDPTKALPEEIVLEPLDELIRIKTKSGMDQKYRWSQVADIGCKVNESDSMDIISFSIIGLGTFEFECEDGRTIHSACTKANTSSETQYHEVKMLVCHSADMVTCAKYPQEIGMVICQDCVEIVDLTRTVHDHNHIYTPIDTWAWPSIASYTAIKQSPNPAYMHIMGSGSYKFECDNAVLILQAFEQHIPHAYVTHPSFPCTSQNSKPGLVLGMGKESGQATNRAAAAAHQHVTKGKVKRLSTLLGSATIGTANTLEYRIQATKLNSSAEVVSLWHDLPLYVPNTDVLHSKDNSLPSPLCNFVCEIPKWTRKKYEIATDEIGNPIKQDEKKGVLREFKRGDLQFNYGCLPRTWEDPDEVHPDAGVGGDNDPIDVCEVGMRQISPGSVKAVKILGILCMIDDGEADWKVVAIDVTDPWAQRLNDIDDVEKEIPGMCLAIREWFRLYKVVDGKGENSFALNEVFMNREYAFSVIQETHKAWKKLMSGSSKKGPSQKLKLRRRSTLR